MAFAWLLSADRRVVNWRVVVWGLALQMLFAIFIFTVPAGANLFMFINDALVKVIDVAGSGTKFLFGRLALPPGTTNEWGEESLGFIFAVQVLPTAHDEVQTGVFGVACLVEGGLDHGEICAGVGFVFGKRAGVPLEVGPGNDRKPRPAFPPA